MSQMHVKLYCREEHSPTWQILKINDEREEGNNGITYMQRKDSV